jgi:hypothetical protein
MGTGMVEVDFLNMRRGAGTNYALVASNAVLEYGDEVNILDKSDGDGCATWLHIRTQDKTEGWVCGTYLQLHGDDSDRNTTDHDRPIVRSDNGQEQERSQPAILVNLAQPAIEQLTAQVPLMHRFTPQEDDEVTEITPGVVHISRETDDPLKINLLLFDLTSTQFSLQPALGDGWLSGRTRTSYMAEQNDALAAVNGDLFSGTGIPQGLTIINSVVATPPKHRATFAWSRTSGPFIGYFTDSWTWGATIVTPDGERKAIAAMNTLCPEDGICLYNHFARIVPDYQGDVKIFLSPTGEVTKTTRAWNQRIPRGIRVLRGVGDGADWLLDNIELDDVVEIDIQTNHPLSDYTQAISGGPIILHKGTFVQDCMCKLIDCSEVSSEEDRESTDGLCEDFDTDWKEHHYHWVRMPRTGLGYDRLKQTLIVAVVDGYQRGYSRGIRQDEFADLLREFGAYTAMELDGGGSSTMVLEGEIMNRPSDETGERYVANSLLFFWTELGERD